MEKLPFDSIFRLWRTALSVFSLQVIEGIE
jgi:hypothetical protein